MPRDVIRQTWAVQGFDSGLVTNAPSHVLPGDASPDAENFDPSVQYALRKRYGTSNFTGDHGSATGTLIRGLFVSTFESGTTKVLAKEGTAVYDITAGNWSTTITGHPALGDGDEVHFVMFKNVIIMTSEESSPIAPQKWSGSGSFSNLGGSPPNGKYVCVHKGRVFIANIPASTNGVSFVRFSAINDHEDWSSADNAGNFYVGPGDGMAINGIFSDGEVLYISKRDLGSAGGSGFNAGAIYAVYGDGPSTFTNAKRILWAGMPSARCFAMAKSYMVVATNQGVYGLRGDQVVYLSDAINNTWESLTAAQRGAACLGQYKNQIWLLYPASGSTNTKALVVDLFHERWSRYSAMPYRILATHPDGTLYGASATSTIRVAKLDDSSTAQDVGSATITMYWKTPSIDMGSWYADKKWYQSFLHVKSQAVTWTLKRSVDGGSQDAGVTMVGNTEGPVKRFVGSQATAMHRFVQLEVSEASTSLQGECYAISIESDILPELK